MDPFKANCCQQLINALDIRENAGDIEIKFSNNKNVFYNFLENKFQEDDGGMLDLMLPCTRSSIGMDTFDRIKECLEGIIIQESQTAKLCKDIMQQLNQAARDKEDVSVSQRKEIVMMNNLSVHFKTVVDAPSSRWIELNTFYYTKYYNILQKFWNQYHSRSKQIVDVLKQCEKICKQSYPQITNKEARV